MVLKRRYSGNTSANTWGISIILHILVVGVFMLWGQTVFADGRMVTGPHGDERIRSPKGECATCHIPHNAQGKKIWARTSNKPGLYDGIRKLCQTCHDGTLFYMGEGTLYTVEGYPKNPNGPPYKGEFRVETEDSERNVYASTGTDDVLDDREGHYLSSFKKLDGSFESHVMHGGANLNGLTLIINIKNYPEIFPLDPTDRDNFPENPARDIYRSGGEGFYCGTCHNPHKQPDQRYTGGFYLRSLQGESVGNPWNERKPFCQQCHGIPHAPESDCLKCHHPHLGWTLIKDDEEIGRKIFRYAIGGPNFVAKPNIVTINDSENKRSSLFCYGCHNGREGNLWTEAGALPIFGDDVPVEKRKEHHPMGDQASLLRADPNCLINGEFTCTSCHDGFHGPGPFFNVQDQKIRNEKSKGNKFLKWELNENNEKDKVDFCIKCHSDKTRAQLDGKHLVSPDTNPRLKRGGCLFCHFIHDGKERQDSERIPDVPGGIRPDVDSLMRVEAVNLSWGDRTGNNTPYDYEDLCFGCHSDPNLVSNFGGDGARIDSTTFTHRFAVQYPVSIGTGFFVSDGSGTKVVDDYGVQSGQLYCGTCHDVHDNKTRPYLGNHISTKGETKNPYSYQDEGFCESCHDREGFMAKSHPVGVGPNADPEKGSPTRAEFIDYYNLDSTSKYLFNQGGSGRPGGITAPYNTEKSESTDGSKGKVICLTCHNTHAAETSWEGKTKSDTINKNHGILLVKDNMKERKDTGPGSDLCKACHAFGETDEFPTGKHGDETLPDIEKGICNVCHTPHNAQGPKLWSREGYGSGPFQGVHQLCYTCHNTWGITNAVTGRDTVFYQEKFENHVMFGGASIKSRECPENKKQPFPLDLIKPPLPWDLKTDLFPIDPNDYDTIPEQDNEVYCNSGPFSYRKGGDGFYCGTCHNPHNDPSYTLDDPNHQSAYLRVENKDAIGINGKRKAFCEQCHGKDFHFPSSDCLSCHHPHQGKKLIKNDQRTGRKILSILSGSFYPNDFIASPNVREINDRNDTYFFFSSSCYGCHNQEGQADGIPVLFADDADPNQLNHHPMGNEASTGNLLKFVNGVFIRAPGITTTNITTEIESGTSSEKIFLDKKGEITCVSCHDDDHGYGPFTGSKAAEKSRENHFLRWDFTNDNADFCIKCHNDKTFQNGFDDKHFRDIDSPLKRKIFVPGGSGDTKEIPSRQCMLCHFIHDGEKRQNELISETPRIIRPDVDTLMRVKAVNLSWGDSTENNNTPYEYQDLCFGCHSNSAIVKGVGGSGSQINTSLFTHRFAIQDPNSIGPEFSISDGEGTNVVDDYGTQDGQMYCGTCHDAHDNSAAPYLTPIPSPSGGYKSPYNYKDKGFCEACHDKNEFVAKSHPVGVDPNPDPAQGRPTKAEFTDYYTNNPVSKYLFTQGGSGRPGGITAPYSQETGSVPGKGEVICLTCHNTHNAATSYDGKTNNDQVYKNHGMLLVKDNMKTRGGQSPGSDLCKACHPFGENDQFPTGVHGAGTMSGAEWGICNACHTPHHSAGPKLWSREGYGSGPFQGERQLCFTCHNKRGIGKTGRETVFKGIGIGELIPLKYLEDHVMLQWANIKGENVYVDPNRFPLNLSDTDVIPACSPFNANVYGFYCGSCHNPHIQKGERYLRGTGDIGYPDSRKGFCKQCHINFDNHQEGRECTECHHPHEGKTMICENPDIGSKIYISGVNPRNFIARPNVEGFTSNLQRALQNGTELSYSDVSATCYGCHGPQAHDPNTPGWASLGAASIFGDSDTGDSHPVWTPREHHPMGKQARFGQSPRAPGADRSLFNRNGELTCTSCHSENHKGERENNYLKWDFTRDDSHFCLRCHPNKLEPNLGPPGGGHHQTKESSPVRRLVNEGIAIDGKVVYKNVETGCANCMLCHYIHDGDDGGAASTPATDTLMRVNPVNLKWADAWQDEDTTDYEDLCYGCHSKEGIVKGVGGLGSLLISPQNLTPEAAGDPVLGHRFSHRFRSVPNPLAAPAVRFSAGGPFPLSDGTGGRILDDYGTEDGKMFCGTCHDVHTWAGNPGTNYLRGQTSPYVSGGFCNECHSADPAPSVCSPVINHRLAPAPLVTVSVGEWSPLLYSNVDPFVPRGKGEKGGFVAVPGGITPNVGQMTCLTCHNIHAAETTYDGYIDHPHSDDTALVDGRRGKLLIIDNGHAPSGSDLCITCHPEHSQVIGSSHDFTRRGLDGLGAGIADKGVCSACHRPHFTSDDRLLWARPMLEEKALFGTVPGFALGSTIYCYDCHSGIWCDADPKLELFLPFPPQDVAFTDMPGGMKAGYYEPLPAFIQDIPPHRLPAGMPTEIKTSGHYIRQPIITPGIAQNDKLACNDCHEPHRGITREGIPSQAFIKEFLGGKLIGPYKASLNMVYHKEIRSNLESRQACVACHGLADRPGAPMYLPATFGDINPLYVSIMPVSRPTKTVYEHFDVGVYPCTDCHTHNRAMALCVDCHAYPPITVGDGWSAPGDPDQNYTGGAGAHYKHVIEHQFPCTTCHLGCLHDPGGATVVNPFFMRGKVSIDFDMNYTFPRTSGEFQTQMGYKGADGKVIISPLYSPVKQTCYVGCHNPLVGDPDEMPNIDNPTPSWSLQIPKSPTPPTLPSLNIPSWITVRNPYAVPASISGTWIIPWTGK